MNYFLPPSMMTFWILGVWIVTAIVHVGFAVAVLADAGMMPHKLRREPFLVGGVIWALATLLGGVFVAAVYWLVHHSTLCSMVRAGDRLFAVGGQRTDAPAPGPQSST